MKLAFISDIHGNAVALESVLKDIQEQNVDKVYVLGDLCFRGPEPKRSLDLVREMKSEVIKGNADEWVVRGVQKGEVPDQVLELMKSEGEWTSSQLSDEDLSYLEGLPSELNLEAKGLIIHAFHATPASLFEVVQPSESDEVIEKKLLQKEADIYLYAHIHKPYIRYIDGKCIVNTGSVGLPFDGCHHASYTVVEINSNGSFYITNRRVKYKVEESIQKIKESDYPNQTFLKRILENASL